jgi:hypothetical protein
MGTNGEITGKDNSAAWKRCFSSAISYCDLRWYWYTDTCNDWAFKIVWIELFLRHFRLEKGFLMISAE